MRKSLLGNISVACISIPLVLFDRQIQKRTQMPPTNATGTGTDGANT